MKHILVIDDVSTNLKCVGMILRNQYQVTMLKSGEEALNYLNSHIPDLILLDIRMQGMNGYEVMEHLKRSPATAQIPVILITADSAKESKEKGIALGAADFIGKPFEPQLLLDRIEAVWKEEE
ncbi:MAG: response regulator [Lachnospiraceae bacterium]|nr:response regulator [Lachnospiraceae bacterium]